MQNQGIECSTGQLDYDRLILNWQCTPGYFIYLFLCRCLPFYLLILLTIRIRNRFFCHLYFWYIGFIYGIEGLISAAEYGITGLFLCFFRMIPQILFYVPALWMVWQTAKEGSSRFSVSRHFLLTVLLLWTAGAAIESIVNPYFLQFGIQLLL